MCVPRSLLLLGICCTSSIVLAASKTEKADRVVNAVLEQEVRGEVHERRGQLGDLVDQTDRARWAAGYIKTADGWQRFDTPQPIDDRLREYEQRRGTEPLTPEQHLELANWCREKKLFEQERAHLWTARSESQRGNSDVILRRLGYVSVNGEWLTAGERQELSRQQDQREQELRAWLPQAKMILRHLSTTDSQGQRIGRAELADIQDPGAAAALEAVLSNQTPEVASGLIDWCKSIRSFKSTQILARQSILSPWEATRVAAAEVLRSRPMDHYVPSLLSLVAKPSEARLIRASTGLGRGNIVLAYQFQRETWGRIENGAYVVRSTGMLGTRSDSFATSTNASLNRIQSALNQSDLEREINDEAVRRTARLAAMNRIQQDLNNRVVQSLNVSIGLSRDFGPDELWNWWQDEKGSDPIVPAEKQTVSSIEVAEFVPRPAIQQLPGDQFTGMMVEVSERQGARKECLAAGTAITTSAGNKSVETLKAGDLVLAKDIETGELSYKPVIRTTVRAPQPLVTLHTKDDSIRATLGHYFWVSGQGWRMAKEIKPGDRLHGVDGTITVTDVSRGGREAVYNLVVEGANTYFVGNGKILSHDVTPPVPTDIIVPGLAAR